MRISLKKISIYIFVASATIRLANNDALDS